MVTTRRRRAAGRRVRGGARAAGAAALILLGVALGAGAARAEDETGWSYRLGNELMSPYCPGRTLPDCPSQQASDLRTWIVAQEQAGRTRPEVEADLLARYGDVILQAPRTSGFGLAAYVIPILLSLAGAALLVAFWRRQAALRRPAEAAAAPAPRVVDPELERLVDEEIARR